jgi:hypothetical protein
MCVYIYIHMYMHVCVYICMYICIYIYMANKKEKALNTGAADHQGVACGGVCMRVLVHSDDGV